MFDGQSGWVQDWTFSEADGLGPIEADYTAKTQALANEFSEADGLGPIEA